MPLILSRAATVYSLTQLGDSEEAAQRKQPCTGVAAPECPVRQIRASMVPLYAFPAADGFSAKRIRSFGDLQTAVPDTDDMVRTSSASSSASDEESNGIEGSSDSGSSMAQVVPQRSLLDSLLLAEWEDRAEAGLFRYDVTACATRVLPGAYGFVAQLNEGRASKKRPTEFCIDEVNQPFDDSKFNFCKALQKEVLFQFQPQPMSVAGQTATFTPLAPVPASPNLIFINVSPIEYGHVLLVPRVLDNLNQLATPETLMLALQFAREANNPYLRVGFNTLGAYATINHLHFQAYYLNAPMALERAMTGPLPDGILPSSPQSIASPSSSAQPTWSGGSGGGGSPGAGTAKNARKRGVKIQQLMDYAVRGMVFEAGDSLEELAQVVGTACQRLTAHNIPHNMMIVDRGARIFLVPNAFAERKARNELPEDILDTMVDPAVFEISGHMVLKRQQDYDVADQAWTWKLLSYASYSEEKFIEAVKVAVGDE